MSRNDDTMRQLTEIATAARERDHARDQVITTALELRAAIEAHPDLVELAAARTSTSRRNEAAASSRRSAEQTNTPSP